MASEKQLVANRTNADLSTGPRTDEGKARSRYNALKHGLTAERVVIPGEDPALYAAFRDWVFDAVAPQSILEEDLADRLASTLWRWRRVPVLENALFAWLQHKRAKDDTGFLGRESNDYLPPDPADEAVEDRTPETWPIQDVAERHTMKLIGRTVCDVFADTSILSKLSVYEARLWRQAERILKQLEKMRAARKPESTADIH